MTDRDRIAEKIDAYCKSKGMHLHDRFGFFDLASDYILSCFPEKKEDRNRVDLLAYHEEGFNQCLDQVKKNLMGDDSD